MKYCPQCKMARKFEYLKLNTKEGIPAWKVAELAGVHENTIYNWKKTHREGGFPALAEKRGDRQTFPILGQGDADGQPQYFHQLLHRLSKERRPIEAEIACPRSCLREK